MSIASCHSLQTQFDSESMPTSNDHQPLPGNPDFVQFSEEDISNLFAAYRSQSDELSPEIRAQLDELFHNTEELRAYDENALAGTANAHVNGSNYDEFAAPQQGTSAGVQYVQNTQASFPTLENFTAPVANLPQLPHIDPTLYYPPQPPAVPQAPQQGYALPQHEQDPGYFMNGPPNAYYAQPSATPQDLALSQHGHHPGYFMNGPPGVYYSQPSAVVRAPPQGHAWPQHGYHPAPAYPYQQPHTVAGPSYPYQQPHTVAGPFNAYYPTAAFPQGQYATLQPGFSGGSRVEPPSSALDATASASPRKRKSRQTAIFEDGNPSSFVAPTIRKRRRPNDKDDVSKEGKFGLYTPADASATVMAMPLHDPKPVDISSRRTHDPYGNPLRTRKFGVMELDDSYLHASCNVTKDLSPELTCVRSCDWTDQPCGLFIEMDKARIEDHLWFWHGVEVKKSTRCQFEDCSDAEAMMLLGRHIEGVHFATSYQCPYCKKLWSRTDSLVRHNKKCIPLLASKAHAEHGGYDFCLQEIIKSVLGYIVPAKSAT